MHRSLWLPVLLLVLFGLLLLTARAFGETPQPTLGDLLAQHRLPLEIGPRGIAGPGAELLLREAEKARYVLIGEEHGIAEITQLVRAVHDRSSMGFEIYAVEIGNLAAEELSERAKDSRGWVAFDDFQRDFPFAIPFAVFKDDAELMVRAARSGKLVGLDQEFLLAPLWLLGEIATALRPLSPAAADAAEKARVEEEDAYRRMIAAGDPQAAEIFVNRPLPAGWAEWKALLAGDPQAARASRALAALEETQQIYELYHQERYHENNDQRALVMKSHWRAALAAPGGCLGQGRALVRLGANHVARGLSQLGISDVGNFLAELAVVQQTGSLHVLVLPTSGALNAWLPFLPGETTALPLDITSPDYDFYRDLLEAAAPGRAVYDLRELRPRYRRLAKGKPNLEKLLLGYDLLVIVDDAHPAELLPSLAALAATPRPAP